MVELQFVLVIGRDSSRCGKCSENAIPEEIFHHTAPTHDAVLKGCGVQWTHMTSNYVGDGIPLLCKRLRPDLVWTDPASIVPSQGRQHG